MRRAQSKLNERLALGAGLARRRDETRRWREEERRGGKRRGLCSGRAAAPEGNHWDHRRPWEERASKGFRLCSTRGRLGAAIMRALVPEVQMLSLAAVRHGLTRVRASPQGQGFSGQKGRSRARPRLLHQVTFRLDRDPAPSCSPCTVHSTRYMVHTHACPGTRFTQCFVAISAHAGGGGRSSPLPPSRGHRGAAIPRSFSKRPVCQKLGSS